MTKIIARTLFVLAAAAPAWALAPKPLSPQPRPAGEAAHGDAGQRHEVRQARARPGPLHAPDRRGARSSGVPPRPEPPAGRGSGDFAPAPGKPGWTARGARVASGPKAAGVPLPADYVKIDDEVTWLPAVVSFTGLIDPEPPTKP